MRKAMVLGVLSLAGTLASPAFADEFTGFRLAMNMGTDKLESDFDLTLVDDTDSINTDRFSYGISGGWALNKWVAAEVGFQSGGNFSQSTFAADLVDPQDFIESRTRLKGFEASVVGSLWISRNFGLFGRAGMFLWKAEETVSVGNHDFPEDTVRASIDDTGFDPLFGVGIQTQLDGALIRLEYKMTEFGDLKFVDDNGTPAPADDTEVLNLRNNKVSSLNFSIVWTL